MKQLLKQLKQKVQKLLLKYKKSLITSNHYKHLIGGAMLGLLSCNAYSAILVGGVAGGCLEFKDECYGNSWSCEDFTQTEVGAIAGYLVKMLLVSIL